MSLDNLLVGQLDYNSCPRKTIAPVIRPRRRNMRSVSLLIFCGLFALPLLSEELRQQPGTREKAAWQWTLEERLARRVDAKRAAALRNGGIRSISLHGGSAYAARWLRHAR